MLKIENLKKYYGDKLGVENVDLEIKKGEIFGFIGPNGAGKSTTIKCVLNFLKKDKGIITLDGKEITDESKEIIGYLPSEVNLYEDMKVIDVLEYNNSFYKKDCIKKAKQIAKKLELNENLMISELSLGNLKKVGIVLTLMHNPYLIILDEPTSGLDPLMQETFFDILKEEKKNGKIIFFSSHNLSEVKKICDKVAIIKKGKIVEVNEVSNLSQNNFYNIKIKTKDEIKIKDIIIKNKTKNEIEFTYTKDINSLLKELTKYNIENINILEPTLEEIFMHYYKED